MSDCPESEAEVSVSASGTIMLEWATSRSERNEGERKAVSQGKCV